MPMLPEWAPQWGVMIAWPHPSTDWRELMAEAEATYVALAHAILADENLLLICRDTEHEAHIRGLLGAVDASRLHIKHLSYNDTWARDFGPLAMPDHLLDFTFNGWGGKFESGLDNAVNKRLGWGWPLQQEKLILEGGGVETDGKGLILTTSACLLNANRSHLGKPRERHLVEKVLSDRLGATDFAWLEHGHLEGDDTDAHIDTLARFVDDKTVAYVQCTDTSDSHYQALAAMEQELLAHAANHGWTLIPLPMTPAILDADGERLPATYANFLITNHSILMPTYGVTTDAAALAAIEKVASTRKVVGVDCLSLIHQHGSLHCVTMQLPLGCR